ncbi:MAG TPA: hypothetical protein RMH99_02795 [Sandaracinaceae bacterium LLY-WYZ-13_1]|nr:hypothetical protein [Sandaracinaceae bacterium LLY-WYZ-13_1]
MTRFIIALTALSLIACADPAPGEPPDGAPEAPHTVAVPEAPRADAGEAVEAPSSDAPEAALEAVEAPSSGAPEAALEDAWLVWARGPEGGTRSFWVQPTAAGLEVTANDGVVLAVDGALWRWAVSEEALPTGMDCEWLGVAAEGGTGARAVLEHVDGEATTPLVTPAADAALESNDWQESVTLEASAGPYLFVHRTVWSYACGAHGNTNDELRVIDARTGELAELDAPADEATRARAWQAMAGRDVFVEGPGQLAQTLFRPVWSDDGAAIEHQLTADACYACGDGLWGSYTASARVRDTKVPASLAAHVRVPAEVLSAVRAHAGRDDVEIGGVSRAPAAQRPAFEALLVEGC